MNPDLKTGEDLKVYEKINVDKVVVDKKDAPK